MYCTGWTRDREISSNRNKTAKGTMMKSMPYRTARQDMS